MKSNNSYKNTTLQLKTSRYFRSLNLKGQEKELKKIHRKYHPMEVNKSLKVDGEYMKRFEMLFGPEVE